MSLEVSDEMVDAGRGYETLFVPALFEVWTQHLLDGADIEMGAHVLDVACGTGVLAREARRRVGAPGRVVGADPAPGMLAVAQEIEPSIEWVLCSAEALQFDDGEFDAVLSQFGMMFFDDRNKAAAEMYRVLKSGGRISIAVWRSVEHNPAYADIIAVLDEQVGKQAGDALRLPYSLGNADEVTENLRHAGFVDVSVEARKESAKFPSSRQMVEADLRGWLPLFDILLNEDKINNVLTASDRTLGKYAGADGTAVFPISANIFAARKP